MFKKLSFTSFIAQVKLFKTQRMDPIGRVFSLPFVIFDFDCSSLGTSLTLVRCSWWQWWRLTWWWWAFFSLCGDVGGGGDGGGVAGAWFIF